MISMLQTHKQVFFKTFSFVMILNWIIHASAAAAPLHHSTCLSACVHLCVSVLVGF